MSEWLRTNIGAICQRVVSGGTPLTSNHDYYQSGEIPWLKTKEVNQSRIYSTENHITQLGLDNSSAKLIPLNSVVIAMYGDGQTAGRVGLTKIPLATNQACCNLIFDENKTDAEFVFYYLLGSYDELVARKTGSGQQNLNAQLIKSFEIPLPPLVEQKAIASVLSSLDDKIDLLHRQNTTLERMAEALFRQWFVEEAQSFATGKIGALIEATFGGDWGKEAPEGDFTNAVNCIRGTDIADLQTGSAKKIPLRFVSTKKLQSIEPKNGDIIFEISGGTETQSTGRATYINDDVRSLFAHPLVFSNFCRLLRPLNLTYSYFIYLYLSYLYEQDEFFGLENGSSGIKNLNYKALFFELDYPMPSSDRVQKFNDLVTPSFSKINQNKKQIKTLEKLRENLLPKLMSGDVKVV